MIAATLIASNNNRIANQDRQVGTEVSRKNDDKTAHCNSGAGIGGFDIPAAELGRIVSKAEQEIAALDLALGQIETSASFPAFMEMAKKLNPYPSWLRRIPVVPPAYMVRIGSILDMDTVLCVGRDGLELSVDMDGICSGAYEKEPATGMVLRAHGWTPKMLQDAYRKAQKMLAASLGDASKVWTHHHGNPNRDFIR